MKNFDWIDLPDPTKRGFVVIARESDRECDIPDFLGSTVLYSDCPRWITNAAQVISELQGYRLIHAEKAGELLRRFVFAPPLTREAAQTPYRSYYETEPSMFWPAVWLSSRFFRSFDDDRYSTRSQYKPAYQGPTRVLIEEFYSPTPFEIPLYAPMADGAVNEDIGIELSSTGGVLYWLSFGRFSLEPCLHPAFNISVPINPSITVGIVEYTAAYANAEGTHYEDWPDSLVIDDRQNQVLGGWVRRRVTALRPMIVVVTSPTSASITNSGATLGGTVSVAEGATVTSQGVVYALTAQDANPEVGNSLALSVIDADPFASGDPFTVLVTGLVASSNYTFKPWALTSQGVRVYGPVGTFTTATSPAP